MVSTLNHRRHRCHATLCQPPPPPLSCERPLLRRPIPSKQIAGNYTYTLRGTTTDPTNNSLCGVALSQPLAPRASLSLPRRPPARSHVVYGPQTLGRIAGASSSSAERASERYICARVRLVRQVTVQVNLSFAVFVMESGRRRRVKMQVVHFRTNQI